MKNWNRIGKIKVFLILALSLVPLIIFNFNENKELDNEFYITISVVIFLLTSLFLPLITRFWSLFRVKFKKPSWNENPFSLDFSNSLNTHEFIGYWLITSGIFKFLFVAMFYQKFHGESFSFFFAGIGLLIGIKLSVIWLDKSLNKKAANIV